LLNSQAETLETQAFALDAQISDSEAEMRATENRLGQNRERIAAHESTIEHERRRTRDLDEEVARYRRQLTSMSTRAVDCSNRLAGSKPISRKPRTNIVRWPAAWRKRSAT